MLIQRFVALLFVMATVFLMSCAPMTYEQREMARYGAMASENFSRQFNPLRF